MRKFLLGVLIIVGSVSSLEWVFAASPIRVLLESNVQRLEMSSESVLTVYSQEREVLLQDSTVVFSPGSRHLMMNGGTAPADHVWISGNNQDVHVTIVKGSERVSPPVEDSRAFRIFGKVSSQQLLDKAHASTPNRQQQAKASRVDMRVGGDLHVFFRNSELSIINEVDLEEYVKGVIPSEMNADWHVEGAQGASRGNEDLCPLSTITAS